MSEQPEKKFMRTIKSYVLRTGRMTDAQKDAYKVHWQQKGHKVEEGPLNISSAFGQDGPVVFEIGFGMGQSLLDMAEAAPNKNFIGVEVHTPGVGRLLREAESRGIENIRVYQEDALEVLGKCIADESLDTLQLYFPDPWHKKKHHKRRIVQPAFAQLVRKKLKVGGVFHMATDWENYAEHMMEVMSEAEGYSNIAGDHQYHPRPDFRPLTKFEKRGENLGHGVWDLLFKKKA